MRMIARVLDAPVWRALASMTFACWTAAAFAVAPDVIRDLAFGDADQKDKALGTIVQSGDAQAIPILRALIDGDVKAVARSGCCS